MNLRWIWIGAIAAIAGLWGGLWYWTGRPLHFPASAAGPVAAVSAESVEARVAALQQDLAAERDARLGLEAEVEMLRLLLDDYAGGPRPEPPPAAAAPSPAAPLAEGALQNPPEEAAKPGERLWFDKPALLATGLPEPEVTRLERLFEESELQLLYLRDRATREGWAGTPRFLQEMHDLRTGLRESVGDETYDWLLYATQRTNRVAVRSALSTGPAAQAGIRTGDLILRYDGRTIFKWGELQQATMQGEPGRSVPVEVMSEDGQVRRLTVPSGPLGIQLGAVKQPPQSSR